MPPEDGNFNDLTVSGNIRVGDLETTTLNNYIQTPKFERLIPPHEFVTEITDLLLQPKSGNVGIGTDDPQYKLHVEGASLFGGVYANLDPNAGISLDHLKNSFKLLIGCNRTAGDGETDFIVNRGSGGRGGFRFYDYSNSGNLTSLFTVLGNGDSYFGTGKNNVNNKIVIQGPNSPNSQHSFQDLSYEFAVAGSAKVRAFRGSSWDTYLQFLTNDITAGKDDPQVRMHINSDGNVGIGITQLSAKLDVNGDIRVNDNNIWLRGGGDNNHGIGWRSNVNNQNVDGPVIFGWSGGGLGTTNTGAMKIALSWDYNGNINVSGDVILKGADCAEDFDIIGAESIEPGTVMVIDNDGALRASEQAYDKRVAGVISGAGDLRPGIMLDRQKESTNRLPLALTGKVYCKVDAEYDRVEVGDLLTTSENPGHAMKASDPMRAFGAVIGKALRPLKVGQDLIPILVALQ